MDAGKPEVAPAVRPEARVASGESLEEVLAASRPRLFRVALLLLGSREDAEDAVQKALLRALEARSGFRGAAGVYTWLYRILVNVCKDLRRARSRAGRYLADGALEAARESIDPGPSSEDLLAARERDRRVRAALEQLDSRLRTVLVLRHYQEMSYQEMAEVLGCPIGTVRSRLAAARERLRELLEGQDGPGVGGRG